MREYLAKSMTFQEYLKLIDDLLAKGKTTGPDQSAEKVSFALLNRKRVERILKTYIPDATAAEWISNIEFKRTWYILTEGWCGDAAQTLPVIEQLTSLSPMIETRYLLRDENLGLMDQYLTNGARSIPKVIAVDDQSGTVLWTWGPRPKGASDLFSELKAKGATKDEILEAIQRWYNADKGKSVEGEIVELTKVGTDIITRVAA